MSALNVSSRNVTPTPSVPPTSLSVAGVQGLPFTISANRASRTRDDLAVFGQARTLLDPEMRSGLWRVSPTFSGKLPIGPAECRQHLPGMARIEEIDGSDVLPFEQSDLQVPHEPAGGHPEIIPHHHDRLHMLAVALPQGGDQFRVLLTPLGMEPLLELIQDQQHLPPGRQARDPCRKLASESTSPDSSRQFRTDLAQALQQPSFRLLRGRLDVNRQDVLAEPGQEVPP